MNVIKINHAFDGFLYAPLFLAYDLGYFPRCMELQFCKSDTECIETICKHNSEEEENWFAICDPFSVHPSKMVPAGNDKLCVIGCLVDKLPIWLFNQEQSITRVSEESQIEKHKEKIRKLRCYKKGTTGYIVGMRLKDILALRQDDLELEDFGCEFEREIPTDTVVATSDILQFINTGGLEGHNIVFDYVENSPP